MISLEFSQLIPPPYFVMIAMFFFLNVFVQGDKQHARFELLGLKCLPALTRLQAQELSPYEVGEQLCHDSVDSLMSSPVLVCALRRVDAFASLRKLLPHDYPGNLSVLMSPTPEVAFRQASLFFYEHEMIPGRFAECCTNLTTQHTINTFYNVVYQRSIFL